MGKSRGDESSVGLFTYTRARAPSRTHAARKSVKRLRYTAEVLAPARPKARKIAKRASGRNEASGTTRTP